MGHVNSKNALTLRVALATAIIYSHYIGFSMLTSIDRSGDIVITPAGGIGSVLSVPWVWLHECSPVKQRSDSLMPLALRPIPSGGILPHILTVIGLASAWSLFVAMSPRDGFLRMLGASAVAVCLAPMFAINCVGLSDPQYNALFPFDVATVAILAGWWLYGASIGVVARRSYDACDELCRECGYNLSGNISGRCPECGTVVPQPCRVKL